MTIIFIFLAVYLLSAILNWLYIHLALSKNGIWENEEVNAKALLTVFIPIFNTAFLFSWLDTWPIKTKNSNYNKFFNIKK